MIKTIRSNWTHQKYQKGYESTTHTNYDYTKPKNPRSKHPIDNSYL